MTEDNLGGSAIALLDALADFCNSIIFKGQVPQWMCPMFYSATLIALSKKDGGVRPIAIGMTLRRLAAKVAMTKLRDTCKAFFQPHQLGVGKPKGAEIAVHALRKYLDECESETEEKITMKLTLFN